jgi:hypothetical protein
MLSLLAGIGFIAINVPADMPYVTNLNTALPLAKSSQRIVLLYTGRAELCRSNDPRLHLESIFKSHPKLAQRTNQYVVCEYFGYEAGKDANGQPSQGFFRDLRKLDALFDRYDIRFFWPTLTFLDASGNRLNGPFTQLESQYAGCVGHGLYSNGRDCYDTLEDYAAAPRPLHLHEAQSNLVAAVVQPVSGQTNFGFFRFTEKSDGGCDPRLMENGLISEKYCVGEEFNFAVRIITNVAYPGVKNQWPVCQVSVAGHFDRGEPFEGPFLIRLNGAWFTSKTLFTGVGPDYTRGYGDGVTTLANEYYFSIETRQSVVAEALLTRLKRLQRPMANK